MAKKIDLAEGLTHFKAKENASIAITEATSTASAPHKAGEYFYYKGDLVIATADIAQGGTITLNTNCKKQPLADSVCELKTALSALGDEIGDVEAALYDGVAVYKEKALSTFCTKLTGYNFTPGTYQSKASVAGGPNANYDTYYIFLTKNTKLYIDASDIAYYSMTYGVNCDDDEFTYSEGNQSYVVTCESSARLRKSDNNLPTKENPFTANSGTVLAFTVTKETTPKVFIEEEEELFDVGRVIANVQTSKVTLKGANYTVEFSKSSTTQGYQWNITSLTGKGTNMFPSGVDIVGVIRLEDESNFIGGAHGNESNYEFRVLSNGSDISGVGSFEEVHIIMNSHLYNADSTASNVVDRFVEFVFTSKGWTCRNTFKVLVNAEINVAYCSGLFAFNADDCDGAYTNVGSVNLESTSARQLESTEFKEVTINLPEDFTVNIHSDTADKGWVTYRDNTDSFKVYFANAQGETVTAGTYITGKCEYRF